MLPDSTLGSWELCWRLLGAWMESLASFGAWLVVRFDIGTLGALLKADVLVDGVAFWV